MKDNCAYCHSPMPGEIMALAKSPADVLHTLPTGYHLPKPAPTTAPTLRPLPTNEGRRWFTASVFDHTAHRTLGCTECHPQARTSTQTTDVLLPDATSCARCHHPGGTRTLAASNNCTTCHQYHDRSKESQPIKNKTVPDLLGAAR
jgi:hypothetical protein